MDKIRILFAASECVPFIKTGGLADVVGSLPAAFDPESMDVRVILPKYSCIRETEKQKMTFLGKFYSGFNWREQYIGIWQLVRDRVIYYFLDNEFYFNGTWPYGSAYDDIEKFAFFSKMALSALPHIGFQPDIIHCHDWQTGLIPVYLQESFRKDSFFRDIRTVFTIHNLKFQGVWDVETVKRKTGLSDEYFTMETLEAYGNGNLLKGGLVYADRITTVSGSYAEEICTPFYGEGLDGLLRKRKKDLFGIANGIDTGYYDPKTDPDLPANYSLRTVISGKAKNKKALQTELGISVNKDAFLVGIVSRLTDQKGFSLVEQILPEILREPDVELAVLGTGDPHYEEMFRRASAEAPDKVASCIFYSEALSHRIYGGCDAFLMPSLFEPCGLSQLMALRYGTLPIVRETGGLRDTVLPYNEYTGEGTGFSFRNFDAEDLLKIFRYALDTYRNHREQFRLLTKQAMKKDFSWKASAEIYRKLYEEILKEDEQEKR